MRHSLPLIALLFLPAAALGQSTPANQPLNLPVVPIISSINTSGTQGQLTTVPTTGTIIYTPGAAFATLPVGQTAQDKFSYCTTLGTAAPACTPVTVTVSGTYGPPPPTPGYTCVRNWYVATTGKDTNAGTQAAPWLTIAHADASGKLQAGDCVNVLPGSYATASTIGLNTSGNANSPTGYIVYRSTVQAAAKIKPTASMYDLVALNGNYIIMDGFEYDGGNEGLTTNPLTGGHCLDLLGHHEQALNGLNHDCGGSGISGSYSDWYTITGNTAYNNAFFNGYQTSGIAIYEPRKATYTATPADTNATYHIIISNNVSYLNSEKYVSGSHTDGNGIILDDFNSTQNTSFPPYPYLTLVQGNTVHDNGGKGIQVDWTSNATINNNVAWNDNLDTANSATWRGELDNAISSNNTWSNNQAAATSTSSGVLSNNTAVLDGSTGTPTTGVVWQNNSNIDTRTGKQSYSIDNAARAAAFPAANPLGHGPPLTPTTASP